MYHKRIISILLILSIFLSNAGYAAENASLNQVSPALVDDISSSWAKNQLINYRDKGIITGYEDGSIRPGGTITRAEFFALINRIFNFTVEQEINFRDVSPLSWYYETMKKGVAAGYIKGYEYGDTYIVRPYDSITREQAATVLCRVFEINGSSDIARSDFTDYSSINDFAKESVDILANKGYIKGYEDKTFQPKKSITRAEAIVLIHNIAGEILNKKGQYSGNFDNLLINTRDADLKDVNVKGNLYLADGIGDGNLYVENVKVDGDIVAMGGGVNSITLRNVTMNNLRISKKDDNIRVILVGNTNTKKITINSGAIIENSISNSNKFEVQVTDKVDDYAKVELRGVYDKVTVNKAIEVATIWNTQINEMNIASVAANVSITGDGKVIKKTVEGDSTGEGNSNGESTNSGTNTNTNTTTDKAEEAIRSISLYAGKNADALTIEQLSTAGVTGVVATNLEAYKVELEDLSRADVDSLKSLQKVIDYINKEEIAIDVIETYAKNKNANAMTIEQIKETGVSGASSGNLEAYEIEVESSDANDLDTKEEIQDMIDDIKAKIDTIEEFADNNDASELSSSDLTDLGIKNKKSSNLEAYKAAIVALDGADVNSVEKLQNLINSINAIESGMAILYSILYDNGTFASKTDDKITLTFSCDITDIGDEDDYVIKVDKEGENFESDSNTITLDDDEDYSVADGAGNTVIITLTSSGQSKISSVSNGAIRVTISNTTNLTPNILIDGQTAIDDNVDAEDED